MSRLRLSSRLTLCLLLLTLGAAKLSAQQKLPSHHAPKQVRQQITELEEQWRTATLAGDAATLDRLLAEDYVGISWTGQVNTKAMQLDRVRNRTVVVRSMALSDIKVKVVGPVAIVTCLSEIEGTSDGAPISGGFRYTRVYQHTPSGSWKITNFEATRIPPAGGRHDRKAPPV